jgi:acyl carrier protein
MSGTTTGYILDWLLRVCRELGLEVRDGDSDFFDGGGTSLTAIKLIARAEEEFGEDVIAPEELFGNSKLSDIAAGIESHVREQNG